LSEPFLRIGIEACAVRLTEFQRLTRKTMRTMTRIKTTAPPPMYMACTPFYWNLDHSRAGRRFAGSDYKRSVAHQGVGWESPFRVFVH
jgi:hypothetical protein